MDDTERALAANMRQAFVAGGGTAGHVFPALAVAGALLERGWGVTFVGSPAGFESRIVAQRGIPFVALAARPFLGKSPAAKLAAAWTLVVSGTRAWRMLSRARARIVVATGGYVAAPALLGAKLARVPTLLIEPNAEPGSTNRWAARWAAGAAVAFEETALALACPAWVTGVPVRAEFFAAREPRDARKPRLLVLGGSQGSKRLNELLPASLVAVFAERPELSVLHQCGERHLESTRGAYAAAGLDTPRVRIVPFLEDVASAMGAVDLVVARAGAMTVAELAAAGLPALLVPLGIAGGHQVANARRLESAGAARVLLENEATPAAVAAAVGELLGDPKRLAAMGQAARALARPDAASAIAARVEELAGAREEAA